MGKSTLELAVETGKWDAGLKKGVSSLNSFIDHAGGLQKALEADSAKMQKFVGMMGNFESTAKTAKGQMNDYKSTIEQLTMQYNRMTDAQKKSIGTTYLSSIEQLKDKYHAVNEEIQKMNQSLGQTSKLDMGGGFGDKMSGALSVFGGNLMTKGFMVAAGAVQSFASDVNDAVRQGIELARQGEGIRIAFERLGRGDILQGLREATHGTVTDLELMKAAVKFNDFKLPVEELGTMLAFAQQKAKDTGQSVDYMVDSIVTGLGRKSLMILDNLGLSAAEIKDKMKETGDMTKAVGEIIRDQMAKAGDYVETAADRAQQAQVSLQNKMEELGRKFAPLEEASNQFWTSMKLGILNVIGGPLTQLLNGLTEAGRMMNSYNGMGGGDKVSRMLGNLRGANDKRGLYTQQVENYWRAINPREQYMKDRDAWMKGDRSESLKQRINEGRDRFGVDDSKIRADVAALKKQLQEYQAGAKGILEPIKPVIDTSKAKNNVDSLKKKLKELEEERKKAVKSGDQDMVKTLTDQINQTKTNLGYLDPNAIKTTKSKQEQAKEMVKDALLAYSQTIEKAKMEMESGYRSEADVKKANLSAQERLYDAYGKAYATYADPKYKEAQDAAAAEIVKLGGEVKTATEAQKATEQAAREQKAAAKKLAAEQEKLADTYAEAATAAADNNLKGFFAANKKAEGMGGTAVEMPLTFTATSSNIDAFIGHLKEQLATADVGSELFNSLTAQAADATAMKNVIEMAMKRGIDMSVVDPSGLWKKVFTDNPGDYIDDKTWVKLQQTINEKLAEMGIEPIKIDLQTGNLVQAGNDINKVSNNFRDASQAISAVGAALNSIEDPGVKVAGIVAQAIGTVASAFASALHTDGTTKGNIWAFIAAAAASTASMITMIDSIHSATGYANGGIIPGNSMSGDNMVGMTPDGSVYGLNAQEVVLNRAQVGNLASQLEGGVSMGKPEVRLSGEDIYISLNNYLNRIGYGEIVTSH